MTESKAVITKEQAEAIEGIKSGGTRELAVGHYASGMDFAGPNECLNGMILDALIRALYVGYEIEKPQEEREEELRKLRHDAKRWIEATPRFDRVGYEHFLSGRIDGIDQTLKILGIKVEGVNV